MIHYIEIDKDLIPYSFEIELSDNIFNFEVYYNERFDYFTLDIYLQDEPIIFGEKILLNNPMFEPVGYMNLLDVGIKAIDESKFEKKITFENMNEQVYLQVIDNE